MPGRAWALWLARSGRFERAWPPRTARSKSLERPKLSDKAARASPTSHFRRFGIDFGSVFNVFQSFLTCHGAGDSTRCAQGRTFVFAGRRSTLEVSQARQKHTKLREFDRTLLGRRCASETCARSSPFSILCASQPRILSPRRAPRCSTALLLLPWGDLGDPLGAAGARWGRPKTLPRRSWDSFGELLGCRRAFRGGLGPISTRFELPWGPFRDRLSLPWLAHSGCQRQPQRLAYRRSLHHTIWNDVRASSPMPRI